MKAERIHLFSGHKAAVYILTEGTSDDHFISGSSDGVIAEWNLETGEQDGLVVQTGGIIYAVRIVNDTLWIGTFKGIIHIIDLKTKKEIKSIIAHNASVFDIQFLPEHNLVLSSGGEGVINVWNPNTFEHIERVQLSEQKLRKIFVTKDAVWISDQAGFSHVLSLPSLNVLSSFPSHQLSTNVHWVSPDLKMKLSGGRDAKLNQWNENNELIQSIPAHHFAVYDLTLLGNQGYIASASRDKSIKVWDLSSLEFKLKIHQETGVGHTASVNTLVYNKKHNLLISGSDDRTIAAWRITQG